MSRKDTSVGLGPRFNHPNEIPPYVQYTSPVSLLPATGPGGGLRALSLPLNLVALIVNYLDDVADLARVTRTCRLLYYMALPQLYARVSLRSYADIRYVNGRPEGFGGGSPFMMALDGLVTKAHATLVRELTVWGIWKELGVEDFAKGRIPDNNVMLNTLLRAALDRMTKLRSFSWQLNCKPLKTLYQGLAANDTVVSLSLKFPNSRVPRPSVMIPPMANLRVFRAIDIDPLCYPDDISMLLLHSKKLLDVRMHFSPRMRQEAECSVRLESYFGRCFKAGHKLPIKHFAMQNFYGNMGTFQEMDEIFDMDTCTSCTFIDTFGGAHGNSRNVFLDDTWKNIAQDKNAFFRYNRCNEYAIQHVQLLANSSGLEQMLWVSAKSPVTGYTPDSMPATSPATPDQSPYSTDVTELGKEYLYALTRSHGPSLKQLLLSDRWALTSEDLSDLVRYCPNLEQLGLALNATSHSALRLLVPFLPKLHSIRILGNEWLSDYMGDTSHELNMKLLSRDVWRTGSSKIRWVGFGDIVYRCGKECDIEIEDGVKEPGREITLATRDDVQHIEIWGLDTPDIFAEPPVYPT